MGPLIAAALLALILVGLLWKPGITITALGLLVVALGIWPHFEAPSIPQLDTFKRVIGVGSNPPVIAGLFIVGFGRLIMLVQKLAARPSAIAAKPDEGHVRSRRDPTLRRDERSEPKPLPSA